MSSKSVVKQEPDVPKPISQKEYLKKYLSNDSSTKKKKKKKIAPPNIPRSKIVNDDLDLKNMRLLGENELDLYQLDEDAPQIAGIIDERPPELQTLESYRNSKRWKVISDSNELKISDKHAEAAERKKLNSINNKEIAHRFISHSINIEKSSDVKRINLKSDLDLESSQTRKSNLDPLKTSRKSKYESDSDLSPPRPSRKHKSGNDSDLSPPRPSRKHRSGNDSDLSPPRPSRSHKAGNDSDLSPPRPSRKHRSGNNSDPSPPRPSRRHKSGNDSDLSPPRPSKKHRLGNDSDLSPPRPSRRHKSGNDSDLSPPRLSKKHRSGNDSDLSPPRTSRRHKSGNDSDISPPRPSRKYKSGNYSDLSPPRPSRRYKPGDDSDISPPRSSKKYKSGNDSDLSPPRPSRRYKPGDDSDISPPRSSKKYKSGNDSDLSPPRKLKDDREFLKEKRQDGYKSKSTMSFSRGVRNFRDSKSYDSKYAQEDNRNRKSRFVDRSPDSSRKSGEKKMTETLSGKKAGLQNAAALKEENTKFKEKEDHAFKQMSASVSGEGAAAVLRDRKTGRRRDPEKEKEFKRMKDAKDAVYKEKYDKWGKGLKQVEEFKERLENDMHEMAKPLARYADDNDLDDFLKNQEREGDPMLDYIREKKEKSGASGNEKPLYKGSYPPNRFNIRPGYRWDGVDRSNGYEKQWFAKQNERKAVSDEAYKWSTADM